MRLTRAVGLTAAALLLAATAVGCGSGQPQLTGKDKTAADNLSRTFQGEGFNAKDADCLADKWVQAVGSSAMVKAGLLDSDRKTTTTNKKKPGKSLVDAYVTAYFSCVDYGKYEAVKFDQTRPNTIDKTSFAACANKIDKSEAKQAMTDDLLQKETTVSTKVTHELLDCATQG